MNHLVVAEADHAQPLSFEKTRALFIIGSSAVVTLSIQFNDESRMCAVEIRDVRADYVLAAKMVPAHLAVS